MNLDHLTVPRRHFRSNDSERPKRLYVGNRIGELVSLVGAHVVLADLIGRRVTGKGA